MADYINRVVLKGRPNDKPKLRYLPSGDAVANFSLATKYGDHVEWLSIVAYKSMAERAITFDGGDLVYIEGRIQSREFQTAEDKALNRKPRKVTEIIVDTLNLVQKKGANDPKQQLSNQQSTPVPQIEQPEQNHTFQAQSNDEQADSYIPQYL